MGVGANTIYKRVIGTHLIGTELINKKQDINLGY
jgi:hypothetical protein